jgi:hypothetical protein
LSPPFVIFWFDKETDRPRLPVPAKRLECAVGRRFSAKDRPIAQ